MNILTEKAVCFLKEQIKKRNYSVHPLNPPCSDGCSLWRKRPAGDKTGISIAGGELRGWKRYVPRHTLHTADPVDFLHRVVLCFLFSLVLQGCYEPVEGCLDPSATNFDLDADEACLNDCCEYPDLQIRFQHVWAYPDTTLPLRLDTFYHDGQDQPFRIEQIRYYWSDVRPIRPDGSPLLTTDSVELDWVIAGDTIRDQVILDNFLLARAGPGNTTHTIGEIIPTGDVSRLTAQFGMAEPVNSAVETSLPSSHPLAPQFGQMNLGTDIGYVFAKLELYRDTLATDTVPLVLHLTGENFLRPLTLDLPAPAMLFEGTNPVFLIETNYQKWFEGIDIRSADTTAMKQTIVNNIANSFTLLELQTN